MFFIPTLILSSAVLVLSTVDCLNYASQLSISSQMGKKLEKMSPNYVESPLNLDIGLTHLQDFSHGCRSRIPGLSSYNNAKGNSLSTVLRLLGLVSKSERFGWKLNLDHEVYVQSASELEPSYTAKLKEEYGGQVHRVDFRQNASGVIDGINANVAKATNNLIREVIEPDSLDKDTEMVITNVLYFKAKWMTPFTSTVLKSFNGVKGSAPVEMLTGEDTQIKVIETDNHRIIVKWYNASDGLIFVAAQNLAKERKNVQLTYPMLRKAILTPFVTATLTIPKIEQETKIDVLATLKGEISCIVNKGITGIVEGRELKVDRVTQKIRFETTPEGSEGAAVLTTELSNRFGGASEPENEYVLDKPFNYYVMHNSGAVLFSGRYAEPDQNARSKPEFQI